MVRAFGAARGGFEGPRPSGRRRGRRDYAFPPEAVRDAPHDTKVAVDGVVALQWDAVDHSFEEEVFVHRRDPDKPIDALHSSRGGGARRAFVVVPRTVAGNQGRSVDGLRSTISVDMSVHGERPEPKAPRS